MELIFDLNKDKKSRLSYLKYSSLVIIYIIGLFLWLRFFNFGDIKFTYLDWVYDTGPRYVFLYNAINSNSLPLHMSNQSGLVCITDRYFSVPDVIISPQIILLKILTPERFIVFNIFFLYTLGFLGLLIIRKKFSLNILSFAILFLLFNFNGHILSHLAVGHMPWMGYFLLPFYIIQIFNLLESKQNWCWVTTTSLVMLTMFLQGSFHLYIHCLMFLFLIGITDRKNIFMSLTTVIVSLLISMIRIAPSVLILDKFNTVFHGGFPSMLTILKALTQINLPDVRLYVPGGKTMGWWEFNFYIGVLGLLFIAIFGFYKWLLNNKEEKFKRLLFPIIVMTVLSMGNVYEIANYLPIPTGERVTTRFILLPLLFMIVISAIQFNKWFCINEKCKEIRFFAGIILVIIGNDLWQNFKVWEISNMIKVFDQITFFPDMWYVANRYYDHVYIFALKMGAFLTIITIAILLLLTRLSHNQSKNKIHSK